MPRSTSIDDLNVLTPVKVVTILVCLFILRKSYGITSPSFTQHDSGRYEYKWLGTPTNKFNATAGPQPHLPYQLFFLLRISSDKTNGRVGKTRTACIPEQGSSNEYDESIQMV